MVLLRCILLNTMNFLYDNDRNHRLKLKLIPNCAIELVPTIREPSCICWVCGINSEKKRLYSSSKLDYFLGNDIWESTRAVSSMNIMTRWCSPSPEATLVWNQTQRGNSGHKTPTSPATKPLPGPSSYRLGMAMVLLHLGESGKRCSRRDGGINDPRHKEIRYDLCISFSIVLKGITAPCTAHCSISTIDYTRVCTLYSDPICKNCHFWGGALIGHVWFKAMKKVFDCSHRIFPVLIVKVY